MKELTAENIYLRAVEPEDVNFLYKWENDTENWTVSGTQVPFSKNVMRLYAESDHDIYAQKQLRLIIVLKENDAPIGAVDFFEYDGFHQRAGLGILIANPNQRNKGYASEALALSVEYGKNRLGLKNLFCNILTNNTNSIKLFSKFDFNLVGVKKNWTRVGTNWVDENLFLKPLN